RPVRRPGAAPRRPPHRGRRAGGRRHRRPRRLRRRNRRRRPPGGGGSPPASAAATYARGLPLLMVPTTLLAMVDSAVGGKVGVNHPRAKNIIGAFHQPVGVWIDTATLATLPDREYRSGLAEVVKYGVILDPELFA